MSNGAAALQPRRQDRNCDLRSPGGTQCHDLADVRAARCSMRAHPCRARCARPGLPGSGRQGVRRRHRHRQFQSSSPPRTACVRARGPTSRPARRVAEARDRADRGLCGRRRLRHRRVLRPARRDPDAPSARPSRARSAIACRCARTRAGSSCSGFPAKGADLAENLSAEEALAADSSSEVLPRPRSTAACARSPIGLAGHAPITLRVTKEAIRRAAPAGVPAGDDLARACYGSKDFRIGVEAFVAKAPTGMDGRVVKRRK